MKIGLKRGVVKLADHDPEWESLAVETIARLWRVFGSVAKDIQHIGSTAIRGIKAKPIIDIAVAVDDFDEVEALTPALEDAGFQHRHWDDDTQILFAVGDYSKPDGVVTHFIHVVKTDSVDWKDYINFRDYMNMHPDAAKEYEELKLRLAAENPNDKGREKYLAGKHDFVSSMIQIARLWNDFGRKFTKIEPINKGWSEDKKYCVTTADGTKLLLRITPIACYETRKALFEMLKQVSDIDIPMCQPVEFGTCENGVYALHSWIDGEDLEEVLPLLPETEQYVLGLQSGEILRKIHTIPAPAEQEDWSVRFNRKTDNKIQKYRECGLCFEGDDKVIAYIEENRHLLENRPQTLQHGDYGVSNMMVADGKVYAIDFSPDYGDPWQDFESIRWAVDKSKYFATGMVRGYFNDDVPDDFWKLLKLYLAEGCFHNIVWSIDTQDEVQIDTTLRQISDVQKWFDNFKNPVPTWYLKDFYIQYIDGVPFKLKSPFDFSFLAKYGKVLKVFDDQDSGNICFGVEKDGERYFIKFAGAPQARYEGKPEDAIYRLKAAIQVYRDIGEYPNLIRFIDAENIGGGYAASFEWTDALGMARMYPLVHRRFMALPIEKRMKVFEDIMAFHAFVAKRGYVAIDFYDGSIMYDFDDEKTVICDIDFYQKMPYRGEMGLWGSTRFVSPEECKPGEFCDEVTTVYTMGATAFCLFADSDHSREAWPLSAGLYEVVKKATSDDRSQRQQSIRQLQSEWEDANRGESIIYKQLNDEDIQPNALKGFNRYQVVKKCWRNVDGKMVLIDNPFTEDWDEAKKSELATLYLPGTIQRGGVVLGAFDDGCMIGFAAIKGTPIGSKKQYLQLVSLQVSAEYRHKGIGRKLFEMCIDAVRKLGVPKMYISAHSSEESQAFYHAVGCINTEEIIPELFEQEPFDVHMEYVVREATK
jgi:serine/threonine-protein kinase